MLVIILIVLLIILILQDFLYNNSLFENLDNTNDDDDDNNKNQEHYKSYKGLEHDQKNGPLFLALKNAANISALHSKVADISKLKDKLEKVEHQVKANTKGLVSITHQLGKVGKLHQKKG